MLMLFRGQLYNVEDVRDITDCTPYAQINYKSGGLRLIYPKEPESVKDLIEIFWHNYNLTVKEHYKLKYGV